MPFPEIDPSALPLAEREGYFKTDESFALQLDAQDPLKQYRASFHIPTRPDGKPVIYFCGHSLGLQPKTARAFLDQDLATWATLGVEGHFQGPTPWYSYHENFREVGARLVGARPGEVVMMNSLTINLHLLMATFYRPTAERFKILIDSPAFPSDLYTVQSQIRYHGFDPAQGLLQVDPRPGDFLLREEDVESILDEHGQKIALVLFNGVNFFTGQWFDMPRIVAAAKRWECTVGFDLAHAAGNVELHLHDWQVDFAVWCNYKYLNSGPGAVGGCFVHEVHGKNTALPRLAGWWGNDPATRFQFHLQPEFVPRAGADGWQVSNPPIFSMAPLRASLALFDQAGMPALRAKSARLTGYLEFLLHHYCAGRYQIITPQASSRRGCQLSLLAREHPRDLVRTLEDTGVICDFREPNLIRVAPVPLYNTFHEVWRFVQILAR